MFASQDGWLFYMIPLYLLISVITKPVTELQQQIVPLRARIQNTVRVSFVIVPEHLRKIPLLLLTGMSMIPLLSHFIVFTKLSAIPMLHSHICAFLFRSGHPGEWRALVRRYGHCSSAIPLTLTGNEETIIRTAIIFSLTVSLIQ